MSEQTQAGWYPDPHGGAQPRWWDGTQWTEHLAPGGAAAPAADVPVVQVPVEVPVVPAPTTAPATPTWGEYAPPSPPAPAAPYSQSAGSPAPGYPGLVTQTPGPATAGIPVLNLWIWLVVFAPYVSLLLLPFFQFPPFPPAAALDDPTVLLEWELGIFLNPVFIAMTVLG